MTYITPNRLENYVERHRADFDLHEPRPELWAALAQQLDAEGTAGSTPDVPVMVIAPAAAEPARQVAFVPAARPRRVWLEWSSLAAALAVLVVAAGLGEAWKTSEDNKDKVVANQYYTEGAVTRSLPPPAAVGLGSNSVSQNTNARLDTAVRGMEVYYVSQLADRKAELSELAPAAAADWTNQLVDLDSSYQQLKRELPRHPQPEVVLTAMNRNLQIRLDILDRQLQLHGLGDTALHSESRGEYALADSRHHADNSLSHGH